MAQQVRRGPGSSTFEGSDPDQSLERRRLLLSHQLHTSRELQATNSTQLSFLLTQISPTQQQWKDLVSSITDLQETDKQLRNELSEVQDEIFQLRDDHISEVVKNLELHETNGLQAISPWIGTEDSDFLSSYAKRYGRINEIDRLKAEVDALESFLDGEGEGILTKHEEIMVEREKTRSQMKSLREESVSQAGKLGRAMARSMFLKKKVSDVEPLYAAFATQKDELTELEQKNQDVRELMQEMQVKTQQARKETDEAIQKKAEVLQAMSKWEQDAPRAKSLGAQVSSLLKKKNELMETKESVSSNVKALRESLESLKNEKKVLTERLDEVRNAAESTAAYGREIEQLTPVVADLRRRVAECREMKNEALQGSEQVSFATESEKASLESLSSELVAAQAAFKEAEEGMSAQQQLLDAKAMENHDLQAESDGLKAEIQRKEGDRRRFRELLSPHFLWDDVMSNLVRISGLSVPSPIVTADLQKAELEELSEKYRRSLAVSHCHLAQTANTHDEALKELTLSYQSSVAVDHEMVSERIAAMHELKYVYEGDPVVFSVDGTEIPRVTPDEEISLMCGQCCLSRVLAASGGKSRRGRMPGKYLYYVGHLRHGTPHGVGLLYAPDGKTPIHYGRFEHGVQHGFGVELALDGTQTKRGMWLKGKFVRRERLTKAPSGDATRYRSQFDILDTPGTEYEGVVYLFETSSSRVMRLRLGTFFQYKDEPDVAGLRNAVKRLVGISHPCILHISGCCTCPTDPLGILTTTTVRSPISELVNKGKIVDFRTKHRLLSQTANAVLCLHFCGKTAHGDLNWTQVWTTTAVTDASWEKEINLVFTKSTAGLGSCYRSPDGVVPSMPADVFAFGIMIFELLAQKTESILPNDAFTAAVGTGGFQLPRFGDGEQQWLVDLMKDCWKDHRRRPPFCEIVSRLIRGSGRRTSSEEQEQGEEEGEEGEGEQSPN